MSLVSGALLFTLIIFSLSVFYFVNRTESAAWRGRQGEAARNAAGTVSGFIQRVQDALTVISIVSPDQLVLESDELNALLQENTAILEIIRMDAAGNVIASAARDKRVLANLITIPQSQWYLQARKGQTYIGDVQLSANDAPYLIMAIPGGNNDVVAARVQMDILWTVVNNIRFGESGEVIVITHAGNIIAHTNSEFVVSRQTLFGRPEFSEILKSSNHEWNGQYTNFHNAQVVAATAPVPGTNWIVITELSQSEAFAYSRTAVFVLGTEAVLLLFAVSLIVARFVQPLIARPMEQLIIGADRVGQGNLNYRINMVSKNEIGQVASAFNSMAADLEKHQDNLQTAMAYEYEVKRANELARSNAMNLTLSKVATLLGSSSNSELILDTLGAELKELGLDCGVVTVDRDGEAATIKYLSFNSALIQTVEKLAGVSAKNYVIPKRYWPDDRAFKERIPVWYSNPENILLGMFPQIPEVIAKMALQLLGFKPEMQLCMLPLINREQVLGTLIIWGVNLYPSDDAILGVFASQVAGILQKTIAHENETRRANELAHINTMILALSKVAAQLESSSDSIMIFETIGNELKKMGLDSMVGTLDDAKQNLQIRYTSVDPDVVRSAEKMSGYHLSDLTIPRHLWPSSKVVDERLSYWNSVKSTLNIFPILPESVQKTALKMAGINVNDPVCYLPIATEHEVIGVLCVWGSELKQSDLPALSILANQVATAIGNSNQYESEARRARELDILLKASEATSSTLDFNTVMHTLASQLLEISGFESCFISEWDKETHAIVGRLEHSHTFWREDLRDSYSMSDYPLSNQVLLTGNPIILQGDFEAEEKQWMNPLKRTAVIILALGTNEKTIGLVEIATTKTGCLFDPQVLPVCQKILANAAPSLVEPLSANEPEKLFEMENALLQATGAEVCSFSEWDKPKDKLLNLAVSTKISWAAGLGTRSNPDMEAWQLAFRQGKTINFPRSENKEAKAVVFDGTELMEVESLIIFPLQKGDQRIGVIELYDFNHKIQVTPEQITLLRTIADKASYSIENARLLQLTQNKLDEQIILLHEKEVLLKEIHHRVKNNLQIISSLLNLQTDHVKDTGTLRALRDSQARVRSMALIHEKLYQSKSLAKIDFGEYVQSLAKDLFRSYQRSLGDIKLNIQVDEVPLDLDYAIPCGLILNELMTNALKYAFPNGRNGTIQVELRAGPDQNLSLRVADDGVGLPPGLDLLNRKSLGLQLVNSLVVQVEGKLEVESSAGTAFMVSFKY